MSETDGGRPGVGVEPWVRDSLFVEAGIYVQLGDGRYLYRGERPGPGWHGHGYFKKTLTMLKDGRPRREVVLKHRWLRVGTNETCHSRPPDDPVLIRSCSFSGTCAPSKLPDPESTPRRRVCRSTLRK